MSVDVWNTGAERAEALHFRVLRVSSGGRESLLRPRDLLVYDESNGCLSLVRGGEEVLLAFEGSRAAPSERVFVGPHWSEALTRETAELYARLSGLLGVVRRVEAPSPAVIAFEIER